MSQPRWTQVRQQLQQVRLGARDACDLLNVEDVHRFATSMHGIGPVGGRVACDHAFAQPAAEGIAIHVR